MTFVPTRLYRKYHRARVYRNHPDFHFYPHAPVRPKCWVKFDVTEEYSDILRDHGHKDLSRKKETPKRRRVGGYQFLTRTLAR